MVEQEMASLSALIEEAKKVSMTDDQIMKQRRSFAYGNSAFENPAITKQMIAEEADKLGF